jgi:hypothetical protein
MHALLQGTYTYSIMLVIVVENACVFLPDRSQGYIARGPLYSGQVTTPKRSPVVYPVYALPIFRQLVFQDMDSSTPIDLLTSELGKLKALYIVIN